MKLAFIELGVANLAASLRWYKLALGLTAELVDEANGFAMMKGGMIAFKQGPRGSIRLQFEVTNLEVERTRLIELGIGPADTVKINPEGYRRITYHDPDGNSVALFERKR